MGRFRDVSGMERIVNSLRLCGKRKEDVIGKGRG